MKKLQDGGEVGGFLRGKQGPCLLTETRKLTLPTPTERNWWGWARKRYILCKHFFAKRGCGICEIEVDVGRIFGSIRRREVFSCEHCMWVYWKKRRTTANKLRGGGSVGGNTYSFKVRMLRKSMKEEGRKKMDGGEGGEIRRRGVLEK
jgi:hypothetical protein